MVLLVAYSGTTCVGRLFDSGKHGFASKQCNSFRAYRPPSTPVKWASQLPQKNLFADDQAGVRPTTQYQKQTLVGGFNPSEKY